MDYNTNHQHYLTDNNSTKPDYDYNNGYILFIFIGCLVLIYCGCVVKKRTNPAFEFDNFEEFEESVRDAELPTYNELEQELQLPSYESIT